MELPKLNQPRKESIAQIFFLLFILSIFFSIKFVFVDKFSYYTGLYSDFTTFSLYLSDIFLILTFLFIFPRGITYQKLTIFFIFWSLLSFLGRKSGIISLNWIFWLKYVELLIVAYGTAFYIAQKRLFTEKTALLFVILCFFESLLALFQFVSQKSLGLFLFGETHLNPANLGLAKIMVSGEKFLRAYGTFPHPNLLSAFLFTGVILNIWLLINSPTKAKRIFVSLFLFTNVLGLTLTFSRAAYLALGISLLALFSLQLYKHLNTKKILFSAAVVATSLVVCVALFYNFLNTRATVSDQASLERIFYAKAGLKIIQAHPWFGTGIGESLLHMQQFSPIKLWPWQIQPVHNYFLLAAAEMGIIAALALIVFFLIHVKQIFKTILSEKIGEDDIKIYFIAIFAGYLVLMQFDHYFYTLQQTQMLLWIMLGIIAAQTKNSSQEELGKH